MLQNFNKHISHKFPFLQGKKLLIAISGGIDSVALTQLLHELKYDISLAHCNFNLRGRESDLDEESVRKLADKINIPFFNISFNTNKYAEANKLSIQVAARELRYEWFEKTRIENKLDYIITAHHKNDVLETFLFNLTRGSGLDGFTGIPEINGNIVRPLMKFTREEIEKYARKNCIEWREDKSNASTKYARNKIRHNIIPVLQELNPSLLETFDKTLENLQECKHIINDRITSISQEIKSSENGILHLHIDKIKELSQPKAYLYELLKDYNFTEWNNIVELLDAQSGKQVFSKSHRILKDRAFLLVSEINSKIEKDKVKIDKNISEFEHQNFKLEFENIDSNLLVEDSKKTVHVDKDLLKFPLHVRKWQKGDYFYPKGMQGKKKLSKFFKDEKFSLLEKEKTWLLCNADDTIIWVIGKRLDDQFKTTKNTTNNLKIKLNECNI